MTKKKILDITTKGWKPEDILKLSQKVHEQNMTLKAKVEMPDGKIKYMYGRNEADLEMFARSIGATILETGKFD